MYFFAGQSEIRFEHTFVFDQDPERFELSSIGMRFSLDLGDGLHMSFGLEAGRASFAERIDIAEQDWVSFVEKNFPDRTGDIANNVSRPECGSLGRIEGYDR